MSYIISYYLYAKKGEKHIITSGIGSTKLKPNQIINFFTVSSESFNNETLTVSITREVKDNQGFVYWEEVENTKVISNSIHLAYIVPSNFQEDNNCFLKIEYVLNEDLPDIKNFIDFNIEVIEKELFQSLLSRNCYLYPSSILRTQGYLNAYTTIPKSVLLSCFSPGLLQDEPISDPDGGMMYMITYGKEFFTNIKSNLKWYKTNKQDYVSTFFYLRNLTDTKYLLDFGIYNENNNLADGCIETKEMSLLPNETKLIEACVKTSNTLSKLHWKLLVFPDKTEIVFTDGSISTPWKQFNPFVFMVLEENTINSNIINIFTQNPGDSIPLESSITPIYLQTGVK